MTEDAPSKEELIKLLTQGSEAWNEWRGNNPNTSVSLGIRILAKANLVRENLSRTDLSGASLNGVNLARADLARANLTGASLTEASLSGTNLSGTNLSGTDLTGAILARANLTGANLTGANLTRVNLTGANLSGANLTGANLARANFTEASLARANLTGANLNGADLGEANLTEANLTEASLTEAILTEANLTKANLTDASLYNANITKANFTKASLHKVTLGGKHLTGVNLFEADLQGAFIRNAHLTESNFNKANLKNAILEGTNFSESDFSGADLSMAILSRANMSGVLFNNETNLTGAKTSECLVDRYTLEQLDDYGGLTVANRMSMHIQDGVTELRALYIGLWRRIHLAALVIFIFPYAWFLIKYGQYADFNIPKEVKSISLGQGLVRYIFNGGKNFAVGFVLHWSFYVFLYMAGYNIVRAVLLWKTKQLELQQISSCLPVRFSLDASGWGTILGIMKWLFIGYILCVALNAGYFLSQLVPESILP